MENAGGAALWNRNCDQQRNGVADDSKKEHVLEEFYKQWLVDQNKMKIVSWKWQHEAW